MRVNDRRIRVPLGKRSYSIEIASGRIGGLWETLKKWEDFSHIAVVTDSNVDPLYSSAVIDALEDAELPLDLIVIPAGEESKSVEIAATLWNQMLAIGLDRKSVIIALGGGVVGDLAGFVAATYMRGIRFFQIPTTLLAQVDSSVGGKTAIDLPDGKNIVGAFHQPIGVLIDPETLTTLPEREYRAGLGEVVKYAVGLDVDLFETLETRHEAINRRDSEILSEVIAQCCRIKAEIVRADERETGHLRALLNLGHTFAHAYETAGGYAKFLHGEAVSLGVLDALNLAKRLGRAGIEDFQGIDAKWVTRTKRLFERLSLPVSLAPFRKKGKRGEGVWNPEALLDQMRRDKKSSGGNLRFVLPTGYGESAVFDDIPEKMVLAVLRDRLES